MKNFWKRFAVWGTDWWDNVLVSRKLFSVARLQFTVFAMLGIALLIVGFDAISDTWHDRTVYNDIVRLHPQDPTVSRKIAQALTADKERQETAIQLGGFAVLSLLAFGAAGIVLKPIQRTMWMRKRFTADAAHDLRTPLSIMRTDLELAMKNPPANAQELRKLLESNLEEVTRMTGIIEDLITLSRYDNRKSEMPLSPLRLTLVAHRVVDDLQGVAKKKNIAFTFTGAEPSMLRGNENALERLIANLVRNAIEYTDREGRVEVAVRHNGKNVACIVNDNGRGINPKDLPHVFERFYKAERSRSNGNGAGSGLGLAIVQEIAQKHGGVVRIESALGKGTTVTAEFPAAPC